jgi:hypothetical protein
MGFELFALLCALGAFLFPLLLAWGILLLQERRHRSWRVFSLTIPSKKGHPE